FGQTRKTGRRAVEARAMTEMAYGTIPLRDGEAVLPKCWRTRDRCTSSAVPHRNGSGLARGPAAWPALAETNGLPAFYYVEEQAQFGAIAVIVMLATTMMSPQLVRRLGVLGFVGALVALLLLPVFGTDFGKGAIRWYSFGFASVQPAEFLKPGFAI